MIQSLGICVRRLPGDGVTPRPPRRRCIGPWRRIPPIPISPSSWRRSSWIRHPKRRRAQRTVANGVPRRPKDCRKWRSEAERWARRAVDLDPNNTDALICLGQILAPHRKAEAEVVFRRAVAIGPSVATFFTLAQFLCGVTIDRAIDDIAKLPCNDPSIREAVVLLERARDLDEDKDVAWLLYGLYKNQDRYADAGALAASLAGPKLSDPEVVDLYNQAADVINESLGGGPPPLMAETALRKALALKPDYLPAIRLLRRLHRVHVVSHIRR